MMPSARENTLKSLERICRTPYHHPRITVSHSEADNGAKSALKESEVGFFKGTGKGTDQCLFLH